MKPLYIPAGPKNLATLFPSVDMRDIEIYYLEFLNQADEIVATTTKYNVDICSDDVVRIHFLNSVGTIDSINFKAATVETEQKSDSWQRPTAYPLDKSIHSVNRYNVKSNDTWTVKTTDYGEDDMNWLDELFRSPMAWVEWIGTEGQADGYLPIVILDDKKQKLKEDERYTYEVTLSFRLSHEKFNIRN